MKFETINGALCRMVEPEPLTDKAQFPCVVRLIQDDSPMGRYNQSYSEYRYGVRLGCCMLPIIATHIAKNGVVNDIEWDVNRYEVIGYPVVDGSAEWALYQMMQGEIVCQKGSYFMRHYNNGRVRWSDCKRKERSLAADVFLKNFADTMNWQIYTEPKPLLADAQVGDLCRLRNGGWTQIEHIFTVCYPKRFRGLNGWSYSIDGKAGDPAYNVNDDYDIIYTEPLATEGTAEWAWQMAKLGIETRCYEGKIRVSKYGLIEVCYNGMAYAMPLTQSPDNKAYTIKKISQCSPTGWQLYEEPEPAFKAGDWVEIEVAGVISQHRVKYGVFADSINAGGFEFYGNGLPVMKPLNAQITRKLDPREVKVSLTLKGTVSRDYDEKMDSFILNNADGHTRNRIKYSTIDPATCTLVKNLLKAQEEK